MSGQPPIPKRITLVTDRFDPDGGGAERATLEIAKQFATRGSDVTVIACRAVDTPSPSEFRVRSWTTGRLSTAWHIHASAAWARRQLARAPAGDASISFVTSIPATLVMPWGGLIRETHDRNLAMRETSSSRAWKRLQLASNLKQRTLRSLERRTFADPSVKCFVAFSSYVADQFRRHFRVPDHRIRLVPNTTSMPEIAPQDRTRYRALVREGFQVPPDAVVFLFIAMNPRLKGFEPLIRAVRRLADKHADFVVMLGGRCGYIQQHMAAELGVRDRVRFIGPTDRIEKAYAAADVTVLPTFYDPSSRVVIESLLCGVPAISTAYNGASDWIRRPAGLAGRVIPNPADDTALAQAMSELLDANERQRCANAIGNLREELSLDRHIDRLAAVLAEVSDPQLS